MKVFSFSANKKSRLYQEIRIPRPACLPKFRLLFSQEVFESGILLKRTTMFSYIRGLTVIIVGLDIKYSKPVIRFFEQGSPLKSKQMSSPGYQFDQRNGTHNKN